MLFASGTQRTLNELNNCAKIASVFVVVILKCAQYIHFMIITQKGVPPLSRTLSVFPFLKQRTDLRSLPAVFTVSHDRSLLFK